MVDQAELKEICQLRNSKGAAFGPGLATKLTKVKDPEDRARFLLRWQQESWSARKLEAAIKAEFGKSVRTGRKSKQPTSRADAISQIHDRCSNWLKWYDQFANKAVAKVPPKKPPAPVPKRGRRVSIMRLPDEVRMQLVATIAEVKKLHDVTTRVE